VGRSPLGRADYIWLAERYFMGVVPPILMRDGSNVFAGVIAALVFALALPAKAWWQGRRQGTPKER